MVERKKGILTTSNAAPDGTAAILAAANNLRLTLKIRNVGSVDAYIGVDDTVTISTGYPLIADEEINLDATYSAVYGITAGSAADIRVLEITKS